MNQSIYKRIIFYHPIQNLLVHYRFIEFIQVFFFYTLTCQIFQHDCMYRSSENHKIFRLILLLWSLKGNLNYDLCILCYLCVWIELMHTLNTLYNHIHVQCCSILLCTYKIWVLDTSKKISSEISHIKCNDIYDYLTFTWIMVGRIIKFWSFLFLTETYFIDKWRMRKF